MRGQRLIVELVWLDDVLELSAPRRGNRPAELSCRGPRAARPGGLRREYGRAPDPAALLGTLPTFA